jgi:hypothetical protein
VCYLFLRTTSKYVEDLGVLTVSGISPSVCVQGEIFSKILEALCYPPCMHCETDTNRVSLTGIE